jgi:ABC-2 type transport system permease protein
VIRPVLQNMAVVGLFILPMLTMRLFAEEKRHGTIELLATSPISDLQIVLGKFLGALGLYALMVVSGLVNFLLVWYYATVKPEWKPVLTGALALLLVGAAFIALGLFLSTLTRNQIIAGVLGFGMALLFWVLGWLDEPTAGALTKVLAYLGITNHIEDLMKGVIDLKDVVFYLSFTLFGLFLSLQSVESQRWRA